jgi:hypothetical protein|tara:strand:+ start:424 stop:591 length:168 start_codon:yes stop_codon:yes gene_type:complete
MVLKVVGNDLELDGEKVARLFDLPAKRQDLIEMIDRANDYEADVEDAFWRGKHDQ